MVIVRVLMQTDDWKGSNELGMIRRGFCFRALVKTRLNKGAWGANQHADIMVFAMLCSRQWMIGEQFQKTIETRGVLSDST